MMKPDWLPDMVSVNSDWNSILVALYAIFTTDFKQGDCRFQGRPVEWDKRVLANDQYEEGFWHLITKTDQRTGDRLFDPRRAERLPWCAPTINHSPHASIKIWEYQEAGNRLSKYVWLENWDYVVILAKRKRPAGDSYYLVTAFHVDGDSTRRNLRRKYSQREP
jgi:hypothetical protein